MCYHNKNLKPMALALVGDGLMEEGWKSSRETVSRGKSSEELLEDSCPSEYMEVEKFAKPSLGMMVENMHKDLTDQAKENFTQNFEFTSLVLLAIYSKALQER